MNAKYKALSVYALRLLNSDAIIATMTFFDYGRCRWQQLECKY